MTQTLRGTAVPTELRTFVGRRHEIALLRQRLAGARLVTVVGQGGVGKTRIAGEVARDRRRAFADGVWWCELASTSDSSQLVDLVASRLQIAAGTVDELADQLRSWAALIVLDNCEHLADCCAELAAVVLSRCPEVRFLTTSRQPLEVPGESVFPLGSLTVPARGEDTHAAPADALTLFVERAQQLVPEFTAAAHAQTIGEICMRLDGLPLAIELAAAWLPVLSPPAILARLNEPLRLLTRGSPVDPARHRTLHDSIAWSYELCTDDERRMWRYLSAFAGGFGVEAAEYIAGQLDLAPGRGLDLLAGLVRKSILAHREVDGLDWFYLHLALRDFGLAALAAEDERRRADQILLAFYLDFFERARADWYSPRQPQWLTRFAHERPNVRQALEYTLTTGEHPEAAFGLTTLAFPFWHAQGRSDELRRWLARAIELTTGDDEARMIAELIYAFTLRLRGDADVGRAHVEAVRARSAGASPRTLAAIDLATAVFLPEGPESISLHESFLAYGKTDAFALATTAAPARLALIYDRCLPDAERTRLCIETVIAASESTGEQFERAFLMFGLGANAVLRGDVDRAIELSRESLRLSAEFRPRVQTAHAVETIAVASQQRGDVAYAATLLGVADGLWHLLDRQATWVPQPTADPTTIHAALEVALGAQEFARLRAVGRQMPEADGIRFALAPSATASAGAHRGEVPPVRDGGHHELLTARELEVAKLVAGGLTDREIATQLVISPRTAQGHVQKSLVKLGMTSRTQLALWVADIPRGAAPI